MTLPALTKSFGYDLSRVNTGNGVTADENAAFELYAIKRTLVVQGGWGTWGSCDSVTAGTMGDGVDYWSAANKVVMATAGTTAVRSYWTGRSPAMANGDRLFLTLAANRANTAGTSTAGWVSIFMSRTAPTGGDTTHAPDAAANAFPTPASNRAGTQLIASSNAARHFHSAVSTDGSVFWGASSVDSSGYAEFGIIIAQLVNTHATPDQAPYWLWQGYQASTPGGFNLGQAYSAYNPSMRTWNDAATRNGFPVIPSVNGTVCTSASVINAADTQDATYFGVDLCVGFDNGNTGSIVAGGSQYRGLVPDILIGPLQSGQNTPDVAGSASRVYLGNLWLPANAVLSL